MWKLDDYILVKVYKTLVRSIIEYSSIIITSISDSFIKKLEAIQNNSLRAIFQIPWEVMRDAGNRPEDLRSRAKLRPLNKDLEDLTNGL
jgi:hypothetical protein